MMSYRAKACYEKFKENAAYDAGFKYTDDHHKEARANLDKIIAIVEPKVKKV